MGITPAIIFVFANIVIMIVSGYVFNVNLFIQHLSGILSICVCALLVKYFLSKINTWNIKGFSDDVINLRWITKIILPVIAMIPFLSSSHTFANGAVTYIGKNFFFDSLYFIKIWCILFSKVLSRFSVSIQSKFIVGLMDLKLGNRLLLVVALFSTILLYE